MGGSLALEGTRRVQEAADDTVCPGARGIYLGTSGDVQLEMKTGGTATFVGLAAGVQHSIQFKRVIALTNGAANGLILF